MSALWARSRDTPLAVGPVRCAGPVEEREDVPSTVIAPTIVSFKIALINFYSLLYHKRVTEKGSFDFLSTNYFRVHIILS